MSNNLAEYFNDMNPVNLHMFFEIDKTLYALPSEQVLEIIKLPMLEYPEKMPSGIIGLLSYNALTVPVIDLRCFLNIELKPYYTENLLVIVKTEESIFGIVLDKVIDVFSVEQGNMQPPPYSSGNNLIRFLYHHNDSVVSVIDLYAIERVMKDGSGIGSTKNCEVLLPKDEASLKILEERTHNLNYKRSYNIETFYDANQFITFKLDDGNYCLDLKSVKEIVKLKSLTMTPVPCSYEYIAGIVNLRGDFITVIDMKDFLGLKTENSIQAGKIIVLDAKEFKLGILVDDIFAILNIPDEQMMLKPDSKLDVESRFVKAEIVRDKVLYTILSIEKILSDEKLFIEDLI